MNPGGIMRLCSGRRRCSFSKRCSENMTSHQLSSPTMLPSALVKEARFYQQPHQQQVVQYIAFEVQAPAASQPFVAPSVSPAILAAEQEQRTREENMVEELRDARHALQRGSSSDASWLLPISSARCPWNAAVRTSEVSLEWWCV
jgi:hypothetical protein